MSSLKKGISREIREKYMRILLNLHEPFSSISCLLREITKEKNWIGGLIDKIFHGVSPI